MKIVYEYCAKKHDRKGRFLPREQFAGLTGFRSVFGFDLAEVDGLRAKGTSKGVTTTAKTFYADEIVIDFDNGEDATALQAVCAEWPYAVTCYASGGKGLHLHIPCDPFSDPQLPAMMAAWVARHLPEDWKADQHLYQPAQIFRLIGTVHELTRKKKVLLWEQRGGRADLSNETPLPKLIKRVYKEPDYASDPLQHIGMGLMQWNASAPEGSRTQTLWSLAKRFRTCGLSQDATLELMMLVNESWGLKAKDLATVMRVLEEAFNA